MVSCSPTRPLFSQGVVLALAVTPVILTVDVLPAGGADVELVFFVVSYVIGPGVGNYYHRTPGGVK